MNILTMDYIKAHSRHDDITSGSAEEKLIELYANSAEETVLNYIDRSLDEVFEIWGHVPDNLLHACLMLVDLAYEHRSPISSRQLYLVPYTFESLVRHYMKL